MLSKYYFFNTIFMSLGKKELYSPTYKDNESNQEEDNKNELTSHT